MSYDFLGKGLRYPFRFQSLSGGTQISAATSQEHEHIRESILQILGTRIGERFINPEFGSRLKDLVFEQNDEVLKGLLRHYVIDAIKRWEKRVIITEVRFDDRPVNIDGSLLLVHIAYRVIQSQVDGNLVYPFYREDPNNPAPNYPQPEPIPEPDPEPESPPVRSVRLSPDVRSLFNLLRFDAAEISVDPEDSFIWPAGEYEIAYLEGAFQDRNGKWIVSDPGDNHGHYLAFEGAPETEAPQAEHALYLVASGLGFDTQSQAEDNATGTIHQIVTDEPGRIGLFYYEGKKKPHYLNNTSGQPNPVWQLRGPL